MSSENRLTNLSENCTIILRLNLEEREMKQEEIISLLNEAITVLEESGSRKLSLRQRDMFRRIRALCLDFNQREKLLGSRSTDFFARVGCACAETFKRQAMSDAMMALIGARSLPPDHRKLTVFLRRLRQKLSMEELHPTGEFLRLANAGLYTEQFAYLSL